MLHIFLMEIGLPYGSAIPENKNYLHLSGIILKIICEDELRALKPNLSINTEPNILES